MAFSGGWAQTVNGLSGCLLSPRDVCIDQQCHFFKNLLLSLVVTETTGSVSGLSITSELNDELNDLILRFHNQLHDSRVKPSPAIPPHMPSCSSPTVCLI